MIRDSIARVIAGAAAISFFATAWLHSTGYDSVTVAALDGPTSLQSLVPALWLSFSFDLIVLGLVVSVVAWRPSALGRIILVIAALGPLSAAALQLRFIGFVPPTAILIGVALLTLTAAALMKPDGAGRRLDRS